MGPTTGSPNPEVGGGWYVRSHRIADFVALTSQFRIRFVASDLGSGSIVEAAIDDFQLMECAAAPCPAHTGDFNGDLAANGDDLQGFVGAVVAGSTDPGTLCAGDFDDSGVMDAGDAPGMAGALLAP